MNKTLAACRRFCGSLAFSLILFAFAALIVLVKGEVWGALAFIGILSVLLVLCDDITVTTLPFLLVCSFILKCYNSFDTFIVFAPFAVIPIAALLFHFIAYRKPLSIGKSYLGIAAVALSITVGGAFSITAEEYFSPTSIFYVLGLGIGMLAAYLLMKSQFLPREGYDLRERFFATFYIAGFFCVFMLFSHYAINLKEILENGGINIQWSNNLSTLLMFYLPIPFYYALTKHRLHILSGFLFYLAIVMTGSRGGFVMGFLELLLCLLYVAWHDKPLRYAAIGILSLGIIGVVLFFPKLSDLFGSMGDGRFISSNEPRVGLMKRAVADFLANPIFGQGIGYTGNFEYYSPVSGAANWYHMMPFQIIGSMGTVGILAYGYQILGRIRLIFADKNLSSLALGLSYAGILLMSTVNPGEFCPIPYELLTVLLFIFLEMPPGDGRKNAFLPLKKTMA